MSELLLVFFLAHLLGDFYFQRGAWVAHKAIFTYRSWYAYVHPAIHTSLIYALCKLEIDYILPALFVGVIHGLIDLGKVLYSKRYNPTAMFLLDQVLHLISLVMIAELFYIPGRQIWSHHDFYVMQAICAFILMINPPAFTIHAILMLVKPFMSLDAMVQQKQKWIGIIERVFVFLITIVGWHWLVVIPLVYKFYYIRKINIRWASQQDIWIGSLVSLTWALAAGWWVRQLLPHLMA